MASSLWAGGTNTTEGSDNSRISTKGTGFAGIGGTGGASMIVFCTIAGGAGAALTGGNFWQGAATGLIVSGLNHAMHSIDGEDSFVEDNLDQEDPVQKVKIDPIDASKLDPKFKTNGKDWQKVNGRWTITTKTEILQWDSQHGNVEVYSRGTKTHLGGANATNRSIMTKAKNYIPSCCWKFNTSNMLKVMSKFDKIMNYIPVLNVPVLPYIQWELEFMTGNSQPIKG